MATGGESGRGLFHLVDISHLQDEGHSDAKVPLEMTMHQPEACKNDAKCSKSDTNLHSLVVAAQLTWIIGAEPNSGVAPARDGHGVLVGWIMAVRHATASGGLGF